MVHRVFLLASDSFISIFSSLDTTGKRDSSDPSGIGKGTSEDLVCLISSTSGRMNVTISDYVKIIARKNWEINRNSIVRIERTNFFSGLNITTA